MARRRGQKTGAMTQRCGWWMLRYRVDTAELDASGNPIRKRITVQVAPCSGPGKVGKREADRIAWDDYLSKVDKAATRPSSARLFGDFISERFLPDVVAHLKESGRSHYAFILKRHVMPAFEKKPMREIGPANVQALINATLKAGLSTQTCVHIRNCISAVMRHAKVMQWFAGELPTEAVHIPEMKRTERKALRWDQVCTLAKLLPEPIATLVPFLALTGLRIGEAMGLRWKYLNLTDAPTIVGAEVIPPMCVAVRESYINGRYQTLKSGTSSRNIPLPGWFAPRLLEWFIDSKWRGADDPVWAADCGKPIDRHNAGNRILKPIAKRIELGWASWHNLRHTNATIADLAGFSVTERQRLLGHASQEMTLHYSHADLEQMRSRTEAMVDKKLLN